MVFALFVFFCRENGNINHAMKKFACSRFIQINYKHFIKHLYAFRKIILRMIHFGQTVKQIPARKTFTYMHMCIYAYVHIHITNLFWGDRYKDNGINTKYGEN